MSEETQATEETAEEDPWAEAMAEQGIDPENEENAEANDDDKHEMEQFSSEAANDNETPESAALENILDIPVTLSVEIGSTKINIRNLLQLNQGSVVELDRLAGEPLDVKINNVLVAHGEIVVVNEKYGVRLTDVISAHERIKKLQS